MGPEREAAERETVDERVERMDAHLKRFLDDQQGFISLTIESADKRLSALVTDSAGVLEKRLTDRLDKFETVVKAGFRTVDDRLSAHDQRFDSIERRLGGIDGRLDGIDGRLSAHDQRFDTIDRRLEGIDGQLRALSRDLRTLIGRKAAE